MPTPIAPLLRLYPEWEATGIWAPDGPYDRKLGRMVPYADLDLPPALLSRFKKWQQSLNDYSPSQPGMEAIRREEIALAEALSLVAGCRVQYDLGGEIWTVGRDQPDVIYQT